MVERFYQVAHMRRRDADGLFTAVVWDRDLRSMSKGQAATRPKAVRIAMQAARDQASAVAVQVSAFFTRAALSQQGG